jgi:hypothetical protein
MPLIELDIADRRFQRAMRALSAGLDDVCAEAIMAAHALYLSFESLEWALSSRERAISSWEDDGGAVGAAGEPSA